jgi:hypothetical protein
MLSEPVYLQGRGEDEHVSMAYLWYGLKPLIRGRQ